MGDEVVVTDNEDELLTEEVSLNEGNGLFDNIVLVE